MFRHCLSAIAALLFIPFCPPAGAQALDVPTLEAPGTIWVRDRLPSAAHSGLIVGMVSTVRFEDGRIFDGFAAAGQIMMLEACEVPWPCEHLSRRAVFQEGTYSLQNGRIVTSGLKHTGVVVDRAEMEGLVRANTLLGVAGEVSARIEDGTLRVEKPGGDWRYLPFRQADFDAAMALILYLEVSLTLHGECAITGHHARLLKDEGAPDGQDRALLHLAQLSHEVLNLSDGIERLTKNGTMTFQDLPDGDAQTYRALALHQVAASEMMRLLRSEVGTTTDAVTWPEAPASEEELERLWDETIAPNLAVLDRASAEDRDAIHEDLRAMLPTAHAALPALIAAENAAGDERALNALLCE